MAGMFGLSIDPDVCGREIFSRDLFFGTFYQQHWGEENSGITIFNKEQIYTDTKRWLFRVNFENRLIKEKIDGTEGIGYCGPKPEPFQVSSRLGVISACFSGNVLNKKILISHFEEKGHIFSEGHDIEVLIHILAQGNDIVDGVRKTTEMIKGAYSFVALTKEGIYAFYSPDGHWPLILGEKKGAAVVATESNGFNNIGLRTIRELNPGELVLLKNGKWQTIINLPAPKIQKCSFYQVYTSYPSAVFDGTIAARVRRELGAVLAKQDIKQGFIPHMVTLIPDSGRHHALGYYEEFVRQLLAGQLSKIPFYNEVLIKYPYAGRSFTLGKEQDREFEAQIKILASGERFDGQILVVCDDSIVRGNQIRANLVPKLRELGFEEIHFRISNPPLVSYCPWGKTTKKGELLAARLNSDEEKIAEFLGVKSVRFNTIGTLISTLGIPREQLCIDCDLPERDISE